MHTIEKLLFNEDIVANILGCSTSYLQKTRSQSIGLIYQGRAPRYCKEGCRVSYHRDDLLAYVESLSQAEQESKAKLIKRRLMILNSSTKMDAAELSFSESQAALMIDRSVSFLQKSRKSGARMILEGKAPAFSKAAGRIRYHLDDLEAFATSLRQISCNEEQIVEAVPLTDNLEIEAVPFSWLAYIEG